MKILVVGNSGVGKTNILMKYCGQQANYSHLPTIGIDFRLKTIELDGEMMKIEIWDTAGQERFRSIS